MAQNQTKVFHGPFSVSFNATTGVAAKAFSGSNKDSIEINITTKIATEELVDGSEIHDEAGRQVDIAITLSEVVAADLDLIETLSAGATPEIVIQFTNMVAALSFLTIPADAGTVLGLKAFVDITGAKPVVRIKYGAPAGTTWAKILQIGAA